MRSLSVELLRNGGGGQFENLRSAVASEARKAALVQDAPAAQWGYGPQRVYLGGGRHQDQLGPQDFAKVLSIMWDLIIEGIVRPGVNDGLNNDPPFFHVTEWGRSTFHRDRHIRTAGNGQHLLWT